MEKGLASPDIDDPGKLTELSREKNCYLVSWLYNLNH